MVMSLIIFNCLAVCNKAVMATVWVFNTNRVCHVCATFNLVTRVGLPYFLEHWKMVFFIKQLFQLHQRLPRWRQPSVKNGFKNPGFFYQKAQNFVQFGPYDFVQILLACGINIFF